VAIGDFRLRIGYCKGGRARFLSHLEVMRALERSARRAQLAYAVTQGFNPRMKVAFGPALPVGTAGDREYLDIWLTEFSPVSDVLRDLIAVTPADLAPVDASYVGFREPSLSAAITIAEYRIEMDATEVDAKEFESALDAVVASGELRIEQQKKTKVYDLTKSLSKEPSVRVEKGRIVVSTTVRMGPEGAMRPDALIRAALMRAHMSGASVQVTRTDVFIESEDVLSRPL
jgi:radical SAM-linked protein